MPPGHCPTNEGNAQLALAETLFAEESVLKTSVVILRLSPLASDTGLIVAFNMIPLLATLTAEDASLATLTVEYS
jgi:hypothetical protein